MADIFENEKKIETNRPFFAEIGNQTNSHMGIPHRTKKVDLKKIESIIPAGERTHRHHPLASFSLHPSKIKFAVKDPEEEIILLLRRHPATNIPWVAAALIVLIAPFFFSLLDVYNFLPADYRFVVTLMWYLFTMAYILERFLGWFFHVNVITDERIIDVNFYNLISRQISDANIDQIQDVSVHVGGGIGTLLNYGDVSVQTAAEVLRIRFEKVPKPDLVAKILRELRVEEEREKIEGRVR